MDIKKLLGQEIARQVKQGQVIGLGSGSTAEAAILKIGDRVKKEGLKVFGVATSERVEKLARKLGIVTGELGKKDIDWGFDGADEVEVGTLNLLKGGGGAMTREKIIAEKCPRWIIIVDESKLVDQLGKHHPIPIEVHQDQMGRVMENIYEKYSPLDISQRLNADGGFFLTDFGNFIIDVKVAPGSIKEEWEKEWEMIPGVVGTGLFLGGYPDEVWVGKKDGLIDKIKGLDKRL